MNIFKKLLLTAMVCYLPCKAMAWGMLGHRIVAEIADSYLSKKARKQIMEILGNESLAMSSNWADFIKSDKTYDYLYSWHYANLGDGLSEADLHAYFAKDTATDIYTKMNLVIEGLKNKSLEKEKKVLYLRLLIHLVGDAHQPMHVGRSEDLGGNKVNLLWFNQPANLHSVWDEKLIEYQQLSYTEYAKAINYTTKAERNGWQQAGMSAWLFESYAISRQLYSEIKQPDQKLSYKYNFDHVQTLNSQLLKSGVRLAGVLNSIFG
jgi:hypothetical protein